MKKYTKKIFCGIALCGIGILSGFGVNALRGYAAEEGASAPANTYFEMEGATVRLSDPTGLRFTARIDAESYKAPTVADAENTQETVSYGVLIFPMNILEHYMAGEYTNFQDYVADYDYLKAINEKAADYVKTYGIIDIESIPVPVDENNDGNPDYYRVNGSISNVLYNNMGREFFGLAYKKVGTYEENNAKENNASYSYAYTYANFENKSNVWSLSYVASAAYANGWEGSTDADKNILQGFIQQALLKKAGVTKEVAADVLQNKDFDWTLSLSQTQTEMTVGAKESLTWQTSFTASGTEYTEVVPDLSVKYLSNAPSVVEVSADGTLSAISAGEATITASCMGKTATCTVTVSASVEPETEYTITVNGGTASATKATAGTLITLTPSEAPEGQVFNTWEVVAEEEVVITDNKFTMPACNVEITATYKAEETPVEPLEFATIERNENYYGSRLTASVAQDDKSITLTTGDYSEATHGWRIYYSGIAGTTISFKITNNEGSDLTLGVAIENSSTSNIAAQSAINAEITSISNAGTGVKVQTLKEGESVIVTVTIASAGAVWMQVRPFVFDNNTYRGSFTVGEIYNGERASEPEEPDETMYTLSVTDGIAKADGQEVTSALAGTLITLEANAAPDGKVFDKWVGNITVVDNQFTMPHENVSVQATYKDEGATEPELTFATLDSVSSVGGSNMYQTAVLDSNGISLTITTDDDKADYKGVQFKYNGLTFEEKTLSFKVTNSSSETLQLGILFNGVNVEFVENSCLSQVSISGRNAVCVTLGTGESTIVTVTATGNENFTDGGIIELRPFINSTDFDGTFTVGEIYNAERN